MAERRAAQASADARQAELAAGEARSRAEAQEATQTGLGIRSLEVHKLAREVLARMGGAPARKSDDQAAG